MSEDENVGNNHQPSNETSSNVVNNLPNNEITDDLDVDGNKFFSSCFIE